MDFYTMESAVEINKFHTEPTTKQTQKQLVVFFFYYYYYSNMLRSG